MERFSAAWLLVCSPSFRKWSAAQTCWEEMFCLIPASCLSGEPALLGDSCQSLADPITSGTLKSTWSKRRWSILIPLLLETRNWKESLPADRWLHKSRPSAANYGREKIHTAEFSVYLLKISKGVTVFPDHKAVHSITSIEPVNYLNNLKPRAAGRIERSWAGWGLVCCSTTAEGVCSHSLQSLHSQGFASLLPLFPRETQRETELGRISTVSILLYLLS